MRENLLSNLLNQARLARTSTPDSERKRFPIQTRGGERSYFTTFKDVLNDFPLSALVKQWKLQGHTVLAADFMGYGWVLDEIGVDAGLAVAFSNLDFKELQMKAKSKIDIITGTSITEKKHGEG